MNELNELSTGMRKIVPETTLIWFIFFYLCLGWQWIAQTSPLWKEVDEPLVPFNLFLKFFLSSFILLCTAIVQVILNLIITMSEDPKSLNFADLCTLANCSVLILTDKYQGYYIHGKAPWMKSDLPMSWLKMELDMESENRRKPRAINNTDKPEQDKLESQFETCTYEIFVQPEFRRIFDLWKDKNLEFMDDRNLSKAERDAI